MGRRPAYLFGWESGARAFLGRKWSLIGAIFLRRRRGGEPQARQERGPSEKIACAALHFTSVKKKPEGLKYSMRGWAGLLQKAQRPNPQRNAPQAHHTTHPQQGGRDKDAARHGADTQRGSAEFPHNHKKRLPQLHSCSSLCQTNIHNYS